MIYVAAKLPEQPVLTSPDENGSKAISVRPTRRHGGRVLAMASAVAATSVSEILRPHRKADSVAEREGFGPWVSPERVGPESSNENHRRYPGGPGVRISLPPAGSHESCDTQEAHQSRGRCRACAASDGAYLHRGVTRLKGTPWAALHMTENLTAFVSVVGALARHHGEATHAGCARLHLPYELPVR